MTYNSRFVFQTKNVAWQHQLTIKFISKQARLNATKCVLVKVCLLQLLQPRRTFCEWIFWWVFLGLYFTMRAEYKKRSVLMLSWFSSSGVSRCLFYSLLACIGKLLKWPSLYGRATSSSLDTIIWIFMISLNSQKLGLQGRITPSNCMLKAQDSIVTNILFLLE